MLSHIVASRSYWKKLAFKSKRNAESPSLYKHGNVSFFEKRSILAHLSTRRTGAMMTKSKKAAKPLTGQELQYCEHYCIHGNQTQAYRETWPDTARPVDAASKLMKRADVQKHIANMLEKIEEKAAERSAEALILTLEKAESRLAEMLETRRHNRGEMLTQMTGKVYDKGITFETVTGPQGGHQDRARLQPGVYRIARAAQAHRRRRPR